MSCPKYILNIEKHLTYFFDKRPHRILAGMRTKQPYTRHTSLRCDSKALCRLKIERNSIHTMEHFIFNGILHARKREIEFMNNIKNTLFYVESVGSDCPKFPSQRLMLKTFDEFQIELEFRNDSF